MSPASALAYLVQVRTVPAWSGEGAALVVVAVADADAAGEDVLLLLLVVTDCGDVGLAEDVGASYGGDAVASDDAEEAMLVAEEDEEWFR